MKDFRIYLTFDIDQDFNPKSNDYYNRSKGNFSSFGDGFSMLIDKLCNFPFSVFLRSDFQIKTIYGSYDYLLANNPKLIDKIIRLNGEINWHIHLYQQNGSNWRQINETDEMCERFITDFESVKKISEINSKIVRIGECVMNNKLMSCIDNQGILIDSTALPGRIRKDNEKSFDWSLTTNNFYHPSKKDYRLKSDDNYNLLEVPMSTIITKTDYDKEPLKRYFNLAFKTNILFQNFESYVMNNDHLVVITHPFEVISKGHHGLISYDINTFENNISLLKEKVLLYNKYPVFGKISAIKK